MKKIVSLVLSLALVLALGTVAFADSSSTTFKGNVSNENNVALNAENVDVKKTTTTVSVTKSGSTTTTIYTADKYEVNGENYFAVSADADWEYKILDKDGKVLATVVKLTQAELTTSKVITKTGVGTGKTGDYAKGAEYVVIGGKAYAADGQDWAINSKNEFVKYNASQQLTVEAPKTTKAVDKTQGYLIYNTNGKLVAFKDDDGVQHDAYAEDDKIPANLTGEVKFITIDNVQYRYVLGAPAAAAETPAASGVTSAKTFDAGVAMYAGLALMSVAGSAVVIGKKKEF